MKTQLFVAAGGKGSRLKGLTSKIPKSLISIHGKPIIDHIIQCGKNANIDQIVIGLDDGKKSLEDHISSSGVCIERECVEPLTKVFFNSIKSRDPDIIIGVNGDTIYKHELILRAINTLRADPTADAVLLLTDVVRPIAVSDWIYWRHNIVNGNVVVMDEVPGHEIGTEYILSAYRASSLRELSDDFTNMFDDPLSVPFHSYSLGWDYLLRILIWKKYKILGIVCDEPSLNINTAKDLEDGKYFFTNPDLFKKIRLQK